MKQLVKEYIGIIIGALLIAIGLYFFWAPSNLAAGGVSGLAIVLKALFPIVPIGILIFILDCLMFMIGFIMLGKSFGLRSLMCSLSVSVLMTGLEFIWPNWQPISDDLLILLIFGALFIAIGQALVFNLEASSGGTDIIAKMITQYTHLNIGTSLMIADMIVVLLAMGIFGLEKGLYAALGVLITTNLIDYLISGFNVQRYVMIIPSSSDKVQPINTYILETLERGATIYTAEGAYSKNPKQVITTVIDRKEFIDLKRKLIKIDPLAFMTVQNLHEVVGEGFKVK
ncbi:YitT family protein [Cellulosilyticum sp. ST5]|uniref:YitT family protein n=1 Tax=unclassified Cellulosilyticum TaxID=2643091 RepID=UPI000F8CC52A|nr:YitT family protein [Cellulosilyticum sp. WCF-2]QEH68869.1 YitT family protein [Cellulosilyticum sp. WCF-2]